jgi:hypothetical protein
MSNVFITSRSRKVPSEELTNESRSTHITVAADMVFSLSHFLSGVCINFFSSTDLPFKRFFRSPLSTSCRHSAMFPGRRFSRLVSLNTQDYLAFKNSLTSRTIT